MRDLTLLAVPLRIRRFGEADAIVTLFTRERGKLPAVAKGILREKSRLSGHLRAFSRVRIDLLVPDADGKLPTIRSARTERARFDEPRGEISEAFFFVADLILKETADDNPDPELWQLLDRALDYLAGNPPDFDPATFRARFIQRLEEVEGRKIGT